MIRNQLVYSIVLFTILLAGLISCYQEGIPKKGRTLFVRTEGADLPVYLHGNEASEAIILILHGGPGGNGLEYRAGIFAELLENKYIMAYLDQRGQGASRKVNGKFEITLAMMIRDVEAVVNVLKKELGEDKKIYLLGHSWGGTLGTAYLLKRDNQNEVHGWIEVGGAYDIPMLNREAVSMFLKIGGVELEKGKNIDQWKEIVSWAEKIDIDSISFDDGNKINEWGYEAEKLIAEIAPKDKGGIAHRLFYSPIDPIISAMSGKSTHNTLLRDGIENISNTSRLHELKLPTLLLWGKYDFVVPPALGTIALEKLGSENKSLKIFEHSGHNPMSTEGIDFARAIIEFLETTK